MEDKDAMLRGPAVFRSGTLSCEMKLTTDSALMLRLRAADGDMLLRTDIALDHLTISDVTGASRRRYSGRLRTGESCQAFRGIRRYRGAGR